jgi:hypothetical protein
MTQTVVSSYLALYAVMFFLSIATPSAVAFFTLKNFNAHVKDKRIREHAIVLAKWIDQVFPDASDTEKITKLVTNLAGKFGIDPTLARQFGEAAVNDLHSGVHAIATAPLEAVTVTPQPNVHVIVNTPQVVNPTDVAQQVSDAVKTVLTNPNAATTAPVSPETPMVATP